MIDRRRLVGLIAGGLACCLDCACGGSSSGSGPAGPTSTNAVSQMQSDQVRIENMVADCMKAQGFTYIPHPATISAQGAGEAATQDPALVSYDDLKAYRSKYGFGIFAAVVYPNDPNVPTKGTKVPGSSANPNTTIRAGLDPGRQQAYDKAINGTPSGKQANGKTIMVGGCYKKASVAVRGDHTDAASGAASSDQAEQDFKTNPQLLQDTRSYGSCLRAKGYTVNSTLPGEIEQSLKRTEREAFAKAGRNNISAAAAQAGLRTEIKMALDDLECGKAYEAAAKPFVQKIRASAAGG